MIAVAALLWITSALPTVFTSHCSTVLNVPSGLTNFDIKLPTNTHLNGIITVEGVLDSENSPESGSGGAPDMDYLKFLAQEDSRDTPLLTLETQVRTTQQCMIASGTVKNVIYPLAVRDREEICSTDYKMSTSDRIQLQISTRNVGGYLMYLSSFKIPFHIKYASSENWAKFADRRLNSTRRIIGECKQECRLAYTRISVCEDETINPEDEMAVQVLRVEVGRSYTLSCSASGAPYLTSEWRDKDGNIISGHKEVTSYRDGGDFQIVSQLEIPSFELDQTGIHTCRIFNKIFETETEKVISLHSLAVVSTPSISDIPEGSETKDLQWIVQGWPLGAIKLKCQSDNKTLEAVKRYLEGSPDKLLLTTTVPSSSKFVNCEIMNGTEIVNQSVICLNGRNFHEEEVLAGDGKNSLLIPVVFFVTSISFLMIGIFLGKCDWSRIKSRFRSCQGCRAENGIHYSNLPADIESMTCRSTTDSRQLSSSQVVQPTSSGRIPHYDYSKDNAPNYSSISNQVGTPSIPEVQTSQGSKKKIKKPRRRNVKKKIQSAPF